MVSFESNTPLELSDFMALDDPDSPPRPRRRDVIKMFTLLLTPLFLVLSYFIDFRGSPPQLKDLQQTLRELDEASYQVSGCLELPPPSRRWR